MDSEQVLRKLGYIDEVIPDILNASVKDAFNITNTPDWADITRCWVQRKQETCTCFASNNMSVREIEKIVYYCFRTFKRLPQCRTIIYMFQYANDNNGDFPTFIHLLKMAEDGFLIEKNKKLSRKRKHICMLKLGMTSTSGMTCSICQERIDAFIPVFKMPCCKQVCHASQKDCLCDHTILDWLQSSNKCPTCNQDLENFNK